MKGGAPGVETAAHQDGAQERRTRTAHKDGRRSTALTHRAQGRGGGSSPRGGWEGAHGLTPETRGRFVHGLFG